MSGSHIVVAGDTLRSIAEKYALNLKDLVEWNNIENPDLIVVGQEIELSGHEPADQSYTIQPGDTVSALAERFGLKWIDIAVYNNLQDVNLIIAGQELIIPAQGVGRDLPK